MKEDEDGDISVRGLDVLDSGRLYLFGLRTLCDIGNGTAPWKFISLSLTKRPIKASGS